MCLTGHKGRVSLIAVNNWYREKGAHNNVTFSRVFSVVETAVVFYDYPQWNSRIESSFEQCLYY